MLRYLDEAVVDGDRDRIRSAIGAVLASDHLGDLRRLEANLARALMELFGGATPGPGADAEVLGVAR